MAGYVPWHAAPPPTGHAFPIIPGYGLGNAYRIQGIASSGINHTPRPNAFRRNNRPALTSLAAGYTGVPSGHISARQGARGNVYIEATHPSIQGWGGEPPVTTHFSAHVPGGREAAIGQFHTRTTAGPAGNARVFHEARSVPFSGNFSMLATPAASARAGLAYPAGSYSANVARGLGATYSHYAAAHPRGPYGGRTLGKKSKKTRKGKTWKRKTRKH